MTTALLLACATALSGADKSTQSFSDRLIAAVVEGKDSAAELLNERPEQAFDMFHSYMSRSIAWDREGKGDRAKYFRGFAARLAEVYHRTRGDGALVKALVEYERLGAQHAAQKIAADAAWLQAGGAYRARDFAKARDAALGAAEIYKKIDDSLGSAQARELLGQLPAELRGAAREDLAAAVTGFERAGNHWRAGRTAERLGNLYYEDGAYADALAAYRAAHKAHSAAGHTGGAWVVRAQAATSLYHLGEISSAKRELTACAEHFSSAGEFAWASFCESQLGATHILAGRFAEGFQRYAKALRVLPDAPRFCQARAQVLLQFAGAYDELGLFDRAVDRVNDALELAESCGVTSVVPAALNTLARIALDSGRWAEAQRSAEHALASPGATRTDAGNATRLLGLSLLHRGDSRGLKHLEEAARVFAASNYRLGVALCALDRGEELLRRGETSAATQEFERAQQIGAPFREVRWQAHAGLGAALAAAGEAARSTLEFEAAARLTEASLATARSATLATGYAAHRARLYRRWVDALITRGDVRAALGVAERFKALQIADSLAPTWRRELLALPEDLRGRGQSVAAALNRLTREHEQSAAGANREAIAKELARTRRAYEDFLVTAEVHSAVAGEQLRFFRPATLKSIQQALQHAASGPTTALFYWIGSQRCHLFVVTARDVAHHLLEIDEEEITRRVDILRRPFVAFRTGAVDLTNLDFDTRAARELYDILIGPAVDRLEGESHIAVVADGPLHHLPFEALVSSGKRGRLDHRALFKEFRGCRYMVEDWAISYLPALNQLSDSTSGRESVLPRSNPGARTLVLAAPATGATATDPRLLSAQRSRTRRRAPLPLARREAEAIAELAGRERTTLLLGERASKAEFTAALASASTVHLATHAWVEPGAPLFSALQLAAAGKGAGDGRLAAHEVLRLDFKDKLVVLSGCETALGPLRTGAGLESLTRAFRLAGARGVVGSLWRVDDSTAHLMERFYAELQRGQSPARALQAAKVYLLREREGRGFVYALPYFWAPFVLVEG